MLKVRGSTEPDRISRHFDRCGWEGEARTHAEVVEAFHSRNGWHRLASRKRISEDLLRVMAVEGYTRITVRSRYGGSRVVSADFRIADLLGGA